MMYDPARASAAHRMALALANAQHQQQGWSHVRGHEVG